MSKLTQQDQELLIKLLQQEELERVSPKVERFRSKSIGGDCPDSVIIKGIRGGRGSCGKSTGIVSLLVQESNIYPHRVACLREVQNSLEESVHQLVREQIEKLGYTGWKVTDRSIDSPAGAHWIFRGVKDKTAQANVKGLQNFTRFFIDEAAYLSDTSWDVIIPTLFRNKGAQLWFAYNPESDYDPVTTKLWNMFYDDPMAMLIEGLPCQIDNPWFNEVLQKIADTMKEKDPDLWEYIYGGKPRTQGENSVMSRVDIREAMKRDITPIGGYQIGVDVARFGDDQTVMFKRHGLKVIERRSWRGQDTMKTAKEAWDMAGHDPSIRIVVDDTGVGGGVSDRLKESGATVVMFNAGANANDIHKYKNAITEAWFEFPIKEADIVDDPELMRQLEGRQYDYERGTMRKFVEPKSEYKKRILRSPDDADALLLCFYNPAVSISDDLIKQMKKRRKNGR